MLAFWRKLFVLHGESRHLSWTPRGHGILAGVSSTVRIRSCVNCQSLPPNYLHSSYCLTSLKGARKATALRPVAIMAAKPAVYSIDDLEEHAARHLPKMVLDYFNGGSMDSITLRANRAEYQKWYINPRVLRNVSNITC